MTEGERLNNLSESYELVKSAYWQRARARLFELLEERLSLLDIDLTKNPTDLVIELKANKTAHSLVVNWINIIETEAKSWVIESKDKKEDDYIKTIS